MIGEVTGFTAAHMQAIEDACIVSGGVDLSGDLTLIRRDGTPIAGGNIMGPTGPTGPVAYPGMMATFAGTTPPPGFMWCDGTSLSRTTYAALFAAIGTKYGSASGSTFNLPDRRRFRAVSTSTATIPTATWTPVVGFGVDTGYSSMIGKYYSDFSAGVMTISTPGDYDIYVRAGLETGNTGPVFGVALWKNGAEVGREQSIQGTFSSYAFHGVSKSESLDVNDTLQIRVAQVNSISSALDLGGAQSKHIFEIRPTGIGDIIKF